MGSALLTSVTLRCHVLQDCTRQPSVFVCAMPLPGNDPTLSGRLVETLPAIRMARRIPLPMVAGVELHQASKLAQWSRPHEPVLAVALAHHHHVVFGVVHGHPSAGDSSRDGRPDLVPRRLGCDHDLGDTVDPAGIGRDRDGGSNQLIYEGTTIMVEDADLDDFRAGIEPGSLGIQIDWSGFEEFLGGSDRLAAVQVVHSPFSVVSDGVTCRVIATLRAVSFYPGWKDAVNDLNFRPASDGSPGIGSIPN